MKFLSPFSLIFAYRMAESKHLFVNSQNAPSPLRDYPLSHDPTVSSVKFLEGLNAFNVKGLTAIPALARDSGEGTVDRSRDSDGLTPRLADSTSGGVSCGDMTNRDGSFSVFGNIFSHHACTTSRANRSL